MSYNTRAVLFLWLFVGAIDTGLSSRIPALNGNLLRSGKTASQFFTASLDPHRTRSSTAEQTITPLHGPFKVDHKTYTSLDFDKTDRVVDTWYPAGLLQDGAASSIDYAKTKFPFISYAHGYDGGSWKLPWAYDRILRQMAGYGYVISAVRACDKGCLEDHGSLPFDPLFFRDFYKQQLMAIEWAKNMTKNDDEVFAKVDWSKGVGIAGHSMGGQATVFSSSYSNASDYDIRCAVMHHAYTHEAPAPAVPFLAFTGSADTVAPPRMTQSFFAAGAAIPHRGYVNKINATHHEPDIVGEAKGHFNPLLAQFTAAWFKLFLDRTPTAHGIDFHDLIYTKLCGGGDGPMEACTVF